MAEDRIINDRSCLRSSCAQVQLCPETTEEIVKSPLERREQAIDHLLAEGAPKDVLRDLE